MEVCMNDEIRRRKINEHIQKDPFAAHLGARVEIPAPGSSRVFLTITDEMTNFHNTAHGGIIFSLSDIAFAAASNSHGQTAVALNVGINFLKAARSGDQLVAEATEVCAGKRTAVYDITIKDAKTGELVAKTQNLVYRKNEWFVPQ